MCALGDFLVLFAPVLRQIARYLPHHRSENASKTHPKSSHDKFKTASKIIEIKDTKSVYNTKQIKAERQVAKESGKQFEIVTGEKTHVSKKISEDEIVRRKDIGPK